MKILKLFFFCSVFILGCNHKKKDTTSFYDVKTVDSLIEKASDENIISEQRIIFANKVDSIIKVGKNLSVKNDSYINLANAFFQLGKKSKYKDISKELYNKSVKQKDDDGISKSAYCIANYYYDKSEYDSAYYYYKKSEKAFFKINNNPTAAFLINIRANVLTFKRDYIGAEKLSIEALKIAKQEKYDVLIYNCYITLGSSLTGLKNYQKALEYYRKAIDQLKYLKKEPQYINYKTQPYNYIADVYQKNLEYDKSVATVNEALKFDDFKKNDISMFCYLTNTLAYSKFKLGDKSSVKYFFETLKIADSIKNIPIQITSKSHLGEYYLDQKDTLKANFYLKDAQIQAHKNNIFEDELQILQLLAKANPNDKSFYSNRYISLNDSLQNVERATRDKFARIEFETDEITTEKNNLTVEKEGLSDQRWIIIGFSVFSLFIIVLWFKNKSQKAKTRELLLKQEQQKANEEIYQLMLDQQQKIQEGKNIEKQRISLELHDGVMGKLSAVRLNLYASLYKANLIEEEIFSKQIDEIQAVEQEIRTIAHDLNSSLFSDNSNFIAIVKELFAKIENHSQIQFTLSVSDAVNWDLINNSIKINLYRILQEALQNIEKYADANKVVVVMTKTENDEISIAISDDGNGFNPHEKKDGIGIKNMKIRMEELNGTFDIQSELKKGTKINLIIPF